MDEFPTASPVIEGEIVKDLDFYEALHEVMNGRKITKREWNNHNIYGVLANSTLMIHFEDSTVKQWILSDGDINGTDWVVLPETN